MCMHGLVLKLLCKFNFSHFPKEENCHRTTLHNVGTVARFFVRQKVIRKGGGRALISFYEQFLLLSFPLYLRGPLLRGKEPLGALPYCEQSSSHTGGFYWRFPPRKPPKVADFRGGSLHLGHTWPGGSLQGGRIFSIGNFSIWEVLQKSATFGGFQEVPSAENSRLTPAL